MRTRAERSFTILLNAPASVAMAAFGPLEERRWAPDWNPRFLFPTPAREEQGAVFVVERERKQTWLLQTWNPHDGIARYVAFDPDVKLTEIVIQVEPIDARSSRAVVAYTRTSLGQAGDREVAAFADSFAGEASHWQSAINAYLATR